MTATNPVTTFSRVPATHDNFPRIFLMVLMVMLVCERSVKPHIIGPLLAGCSL
jgi:hypothetical protein